MAWSLRDTGSEAALQAELQAAESRHDHGLESELATLRGSFVEINAWHCSCVIQAQKRLYKQNFKLLNPSTSMS